MVAPAGRHGGFRSPGISHGIVNLVRGRIDSHGPAQSVQFATQRRYGQGRTRGRHGGFRGPVIAGRAPEVVGAGGNGNGGEAELQAGEGGAGRVGGGRNSGDAHLVYVNAGRGLYGGNRRAQRQPAVIGHAARVISLHAEVVSGIGQQRIGVERERIPGHGRDLHAQEIRRGGSLHLEVRAGAVPAGGRAAGGPGHPDGIGVYLRERLPVGGRPDISQRVGRDRHALSGQRAAQAARLGLEVVKRIGRQAEDHARRAGHVGLVGGAETEAANDVESAAGLHAGHYPPRGRQRGPGGPGVRRRVVLFVGAGTVDGVHTARGVQFSAQAGQGGPVPQRRQPGLGGPGIAGGVILMVQVGERAAHRSAHHVDPAAHRRHRHIIPDLRHRGFGRPSVGLRVIHLVESAVAAYRVEFPIHYGSAQPSTGRRQRRLSGPGIGDRVVRLVLSQVQAVETAHRVQFAAYNPGRGYLARAGQGRFGSPGIGGGVVFVVIVVVTAAAVAAAHHVDLAAYSAARVVPALEIQGGPGFPIAAGGAPDVEGGAGGNSHGGTLALQAREGRRGRVGGGHYGADAHIVEINVGRGFYMRHRGAKRQPAVIGHAAGIVGLHAEVIRGVGGQGQRGAGHVISQRRNYYAGEIRRRGGVHQEARAGAVVADSRRAGRPGHRRAGEVNPGERLAVGWHTHGGQGVGGDAGYLRRCHPVRIARLGFEGILGVGRQPGELAGYAGHVLVVGSGAGAAADRVYTPRHGRGGQAVISQGHGGLNGPGVGDGIISHVLGQRTAVITAHHVQLSADCGAAGIMTGARHGRPGSPGIQDGVVLLRYRHGRAVGASRRVKFPADRGRCEVPARSRYGALCGPGIGGRVVSLGLVFIAGIVAADGVDLSVQRHGRQLVADGGHTGFSGPGIGGRIVGVGKKHIAARIIAAHDVDPPAHGGGPELAARGGHRRPGGPDICCGVKFLVLIVICAGIAAQRVDLAAERDGGEVIAPGRERRARIPVITAGAPDAVNSIGGYINGGQAAVQAGEQRRVGGGGDGAGPHLVEVDAGGRLYGSGHYRERHPFRGRAGAVYSVNAQVVVGVGHCKAHYLGAAVERKAGGHHRREIRHGGGLHGIPGVGAVAVGVPGGSY